MELETEAFLVQKCRTAIEQQLGWGSGEDWSTQDFEALSAKIMEKTHVQLSAVTLKRIWGKIKYDSRPTITTLNALAQFVGYENWRAFKQEQNAVSSDEAESLDEVAPPVTPPVKFDKGIIWAIAIVGLAGLVYAVWPSNETLDASRFAFSSKKVVDVGVPNTVVFDYDASAANPDDSVFIQQTWDKRLSRQVGREQKQHTSIYYLPGFFQAKLRVNDQVVKEHNLFIKTNGWLTAVELSPVPVYFEADAARKDGYFGLSKEQVESKNISLQPQAPWVGYYNIDNLADVYSNDFVFEAEVKNDYREGAAACQHSEVRVTFEGAALVIPLSIPGCVSELAFRDRNGKKADLSAFGVDFSDWVKVRAEVKDTLGFVYVNGKKADEFSVKMDPMKFAGVGFRFQGTGSVHFVRMANHKGNIKYEEDFQ